VDAVVTPGPAKIFKRYVALELARLRKDAGFKREEVATHLGCSLGHVTQLETMWALPKPPEIRSLLPFYGEPDRVEDFLKLADAARRGKDWWVEFPGVPKWLDLLLGMEAAATTINSYDTMLIAGLFQTPAYAESVIRAGEPHLSDTEVEQRLKLRLVRQDVLERRPDPPTVWSILDEAVLARHHPKPAVMREQLEQLVRLSARPNVVIQVLPFSAPTPHLGMDGTFTVLTFAPELVGDPGVAYTESRIKGTYYEDAAEIARYQDTWNWVQLLALSPDESRAALARRAQELDVP
jgi:transcriptional regulator with XRE-family HTH domain